jgi:hypothetical protein
MKTGLLFESCTDFYRISRLDARLLMKEPITLNYQIFGELD